MIRFALEIRNCHLWLTLALALTLLLTGASEAREAGGLVLDATTTELASSYNVVPVREAIAECRNGNFAEAVPVLKKYAAKSDVAATYVLAALYLGGTGVEKSEEQAIELLGKNVAGGHTPSMVRLAKLKQKQSPAVALQLYKQAAAGSNPLAQLELGRIFESGLLGSRANPKLAFKYYEKAHKNKHVLGTYHMARCYDTGVGVSPNALESTRLFRQAATAGAGSANTVMARRYFEGKGVEADPVAAVGWLLRGTQAGSAEAMVLLGQRYEAGDVIGKDLNRAGQLYSAAAKLNDPVGRYQLAQLYLNGTGTKKDPVRAFVLLEGATSYPKAVEQLAQLTKALSKEQLELARKKIAEAAEANN